MVAVKGPNGSGKSTFMLMIAGQHAPQEGKMMVQTDSSSTPALPGNNWFHHYSIAAPYLELIEEFTLREMIDFHFSLKKPEEGMTTKVIISQMGLEKAANRQIRNFSSGMKQKTKLALAIFADTPVLLLDEPGSNLDSEAFALYEEWMYKRAANKLVVIASNNEPETRHCQRVLFLPDYK